MKRLALALITLAVSGWSQSYFEASNRTSVFTLTAGAKALPSAVKESRAFHSIQAAAPRIQPMNGHVLITLPIGSFNRAGTDIALFDIKGRQVYRQNSMQGTSLRIETRSFAPGVYSMLLRIDGKSYSRLVPISAVGRGK